MKYLLVLFICSVSLTGCGIGSSGWGVSFGDYFDPGPSSGYDHPFSNLHYTELGCQITWPPSFTKAQWNETIWIYGVVWREGADVDMYQWSGPEWSVDNGRIGESYYIFDRVYQEIWVRFPFEGSIIGPGQHEVKLTVWDQFAGGYFPISDSIVLLIE